MGNICRSPSAEAIFQEKVRQSGLGDSITCDSAGTIDYHAGNRADSRMRQAAAKRGYHLDSLARQVRTEDFSRFDHIIAMDRDNLAFLEAMRPDHPESARLSLMCDFSRNHPCREVPDPYYGGKNGFEQVLDILEDACDGLLEEMKNGNR